MVTGYARGTDAAKITKLEDEAKEPGKKLASDIDLFGEGGAMLRRFMLNHCTKATFVERLLLWYVCVYI